MPSSDPVPTRYRNQALPLPAYLVCDGDPEAVTVGNSWRVAGVYRITRHKVELKGLDRNVRLVHGDELLSASVLGPWPRQVLCTCGAASAISGIVGDPGLHVATCPVAPCPAHDGIAVYPRRWNRALPGGWYWGGEVCGDHQWKTAVRGGFTHVSANELVRYGRGGAISSSSSPMSCFYLPATGV